MSFNLKERMAFAINDMVNIGLDEMFSPEDAKELRELHKAEAEKAKQRGKRELVISLRNCISEGQDATRDGEGFPETREILARWTIGLENIGIDPQQVLERTYERDRVTSHLNYFVCRTILEDSSALDTEERNRLDQILRKFEMKWGDG